MEQQLEAALKKISAAAGDRRQQESNSRGEFEGGEEDSVSGSDV